VINIVPATTTPIAATSQPFESEPVAGNTGACITVVAVGFTSVTVATTVVEVDTSVVEVDTSVVEVDTSVVEVDTSVVEVDTSVVVDAGVLSTCVMVNASEPPIAFIK
jgi:hypothetical protein